VLEETWDGTPQDLTHVRAVLNTLIDLDLALIEDAYQTEYMIRRQATERLALIGQVAGGIAHELRNPLNVIKTSVFYLLNAKSASPEKLAVHLDRIERQVGLADGVIASLVRFARMPLPDLQPFDVETLIGEALSAVERPANVEVVSGVAGSITRAVGDVNQIRIVLDNLIRNAYEAMPDGGSLRIDAVSRPPHLDIVVTDTGHGIEPDKLKRVMEPFYSTKARGIGLGLAMAKAIVEKNNGRITADSEPGKGATFTIRLKSHAAT
jgi:signal transduction histidine kinase